MNLGQHLARKAASSVISSRALKQIRREHDTWASSADLHTAYYTLQATSTSDPLTQRPIHSTFTFVKVEKWGPRTGQLIADGGTGSWTLWYQYGPFTTTRMPTAADCTAEDDRAFAAFQCSTQAQIQQLYPASVEHLVAA